MKVALALKPKESNQKGTQVSGVKMFVTDKCNDTYKGPAVRIWLLRSMNSKETSLAEMNKAENGNWGYVLNGLRELWLLR